MQLLVTGYDMQHNIFGERLSLKRMPLVTVSRFDENGHHSFISRYTRDSGNSLLNAITYCVQNFDRDNL